ncbi:hypothetical protein Sru01_36750 [Sphaerisporangium rufum]|uniref:Uncharacterized protein n=1 Tax=Sphaerisporangium rufum TaxID=1381558 RepID=A0A919R3M0_9ACTN|nr:hypothetical protein [Sphaerisporangium rufum]GII78693.1 hypothetical protein Sru01_36750 [Sphaerisporangium rufum]
MPGVTALGGTVAVLLRHGTPVHDMALFSGYVVLYLALPGTLLARALYPGRRTRAEDAALGLAIGHAAELLVYLPARALGAPRLILIWPAATVLAFLAVPRLRRHWRGGPRPAVPGWWPYWPAAIMIVLLLTSATGYFGATPLAWPALARIPTDVPFHLALAGELRHHLPPGMPGVAGEPLSYHWFAHAHLAAASWATGVEPLVLLTRLDALPMVAALLVLLAATARRIVGTWTGAGAALLGAVFIGTPGMYLTTRMIFGWGGIPGEAWTSPTQTYAALLFAPAFLILLDLLDGRRSGARPWLLLGALLVAVMGAKSTFLPVLLAGLLAVLAAAALAGRGTHRPALVAAGLCAALLLFAHLVLFGGGRQGIVPALFSFVTETPEKLGGRPPLAGLAASGGLGALFLLCCALTCCGAAGLIGDRRELARPVVPLVLGMAGAGYACLLLVTHPGASQYFFLFSAYPYLAILCVHGVRRRCLRSGTPRRQAGCALAAGPLLVLAIAAACRVRVPLPAGSSGYLVFLPYLLLCLAIAAGGLAVTLAAGPRRAAALTLACCAGAGLLGCLPGRLLTFAAGRTADRAPAVPPGTRPPADPVPPGAAPAARWLRDHSAPGDLVATNTHCRWGHENPCQSNQFWLSGLAERRMLLEGWAYSPTGITGWRPGRPYNGDPFWDRRLLAVNDAATVAGSAAALAELRDRHGVRWLLVDERRTAPGAPLAEHARLSFRTGGYAVYRLRPAR